MKLLFFCENTQPINICQNIFRLVLIKTRLVVDNGREKQINMNEKIGNHQVNWKATHFVGAEIKTPVAGITFVAKRRYPSHSRRRSPYFKVDSDSQQTLVPIYRLGFRRAWKAALKELGGGQWTQELVRYARKAPPIETFVKLS